MKNPDSFEETYRQFLDDELLSRVNEWESLRPEARAALRSELAKRGLDQERESDVGATEESAQVVEPSVPAPPVGTQDSNIIDSRSSTGDELVTIRTFENSVQAHLARNLLEAGGVSAFLANEHMVSLAWPLNIALGGVKLQVRDSDADEALAILAQHDSPDLLARPSCDPASTEEIGAPPETGPAESDEAEPSLTTRERNADRAERAALIGILLPPLQLYALWLVVKVAVSHERLGSGHRRNVVLAAIISLTLTGSFFYVLLT